MLCDVWLVHCSICNLHTTIRWREVNKRYEHNNVDVIVVVIRRCDPLVCMHITYTSIQPLAHIFTNCSSGNRSQLPPPVTRTATSVDWRKYAPTFVSSVHDRSRCRCRRWFLAIRKLTRNVVIWACFAVLWISLAASISKLTSAFPHHQIPPTKQKYNHFNPTEN